MNHKESTVNLMNNTQYMNTNTSSVSTTLLQEKIEQLEKEKVNLLATINSMSIYNDKVLKFNNYVDDKNKINILRENTSALNKKSEINEIINDYEVKDVMHDLHNLNKESSISINYNKENNTINNMSHLDGKDSRIEYLEAFN